MVSTLGLEKICLICDESAEDYATRILAYVICAQRPVSDYELPTYACDDHTKAEYDKKYEAILTSVKTQAASIPRLKVTLQRDGAMRADREQQEPDVVSSPPAPAPPPATTLRPKHKKVKQSNSDATNPGSRIEEHFDNMTNFEAAAVSGALSHAKIAMRELEKAVHEHKKLNLESVASHLVSIRLGLFYETAGKILGSAHGTKKEESEPEHCENPEDVVERNALVALATEVTKEGVPEQMAEIQRLIDRI